MPVMSLTFDDFRELFLAISYLIGGFVAGGALYAFGFGPFAILLGGIFWPFVCLAAIGFWFFA